MGKCFGYRPKLTVSPGTDSWLKTARRLPPGSLAPPLVSEPLSEPAVLLPSWSWSESEVFDSDRVPSEKTPAAPEPWCSDGEALGDRPPGEQPESGEGRKGDCGPAAEAWDSRAGEASKAESVSSKAYEGRSVMSAQEGGEADRV